MNQIKLTGVTYPFNASLAAMIAAEKKTGLSFTHDGENFELIGQMVVEGINSGYRVKGVDESVDESILDHVTTDNLEDVVNAISGSGEEDAEKKQKPGED